MPSVLTGNSGFGQGAFGTAWANQNNAQIALQNAWQNYANPLYAPAQSAFTTSKDQMWGDGGFYPQLQGNIQNYGSKIPGMFNSGNLVNNDQFGQGLGNLYNTGQDLGARTGNTASNVFAGGGWTPQYQQGFDTLGGWMSGGMPQQGNVNNLSNSLLNNFGQSAQTQSMADRGSEAMNIGSGNFGNLMAAISNPLAGVLNNQGQNAITRQLQGVGSNAVGSNLGVAGLSGTGAQGEQTALGVLKGAGATPYTNALQQFGVGQATRNPLMSTPQALSMAQNTASQQVKNAAEAAYAQAVARGGGPGSNVANGATNRALADFGDRGASTIDSAVQQALLNQQQLGLAEQQQAGNLALGGGGLQQGFLNTGGNILQGLEQTANQRLGTGGGLLNDSGSLQNQMFLGGMGLTPQLMNANTNFAGTLGQIGLGAGNLDNSRMNTGLTGANLLQQNQLGGMNLFNNMMGNQNQYALGAGNLSNQAAGTQGNTLNNFLAQQLGLGQLGLGAAQGQSGAMNNFLTQGNNYGDLLNRNYQASINPLLGISQLSGDLYGRTLSNLPGFAGAAAQIANYNPYSPIMTLYGNLVNGGGKAMAGGG